MTRISKLAARGLIGASEVYSVAVKNGKLVSFTSYEGGQWVHGFDRNWEDVREIFLSVRIPVRTVQVHCGGKVVVKEDYEKVFSAACEQAKAMLAGEAWYAVNCGLDAGLREKLADLAATGQCVEDLDLVSVAGGRITVEAMLAAIAKAQV